MNRDHWTGIGSLFSCVLFAVALQGCAPGAADEPADEDDAVGEAASEILGGIWSKGAFTCDFRIPANFPGETLAPIIERDRMYMADRPGFQKKRIPIGFDPQGNFLAGGRYLFKTEHRARQYKEWAEEEFDLDGTLFFDRSYFEEIDCHSWKALHVYEAPSASTEHIVVRTERWSVSGCYQKHALEQKWSAILAEAKARGFSSVWMLYNGDEDLASLVYTDNRVGPVAPGQLDVPSLQALEASTPLGHHLDPYGWTKTFDRSQFVLTEWHPFEEGDHGEPSLWPNSAPLPAPYCTDGVCEVSRGEDSSTCPADCTPACGNKHCGGSENTMNCPGDCRID